MVLTLDGPEPAPDVVSNTELGWAANLFPKSCGGRNRGLSLRIISPRGVRCSVISFVTFLTWNPHQRNTRLSSQTSSPTNLSIQNCADKCGAAVVPIPGWDDNSLKSYEGRTENAHIDLSPRPLRDGRWG
jgi:hypothetical protein